MIVAVSENARIVCQFSCGAASAVATKLAIAKFGSTHDVQIINAFIKEEHPDNRRFLSDCEKWFGLPVTVLREEKHGASTHEIFRRRRYMKGPNGAPCSQILKRRLLDQWKQDGDIMVFGFTADGPDAARFYEFCAENPDRPAIAPLVENKLTKEDCKAMIQRAGIELPIMYRMGYHNANCIGCVKGGQGYWQAIRADFPQQFEAVLKIQADIGPGANFLRFRSGPRKNQRMSLAELPVGPGTRNEQLPSCSFFCESAERMIDEKSDFTHQGAPAA